MIRRTPPRTNRTIPPKLEHAPHQVRVPGFLLDRDIGLGDVIKKTTQAIGIKPCSGCQKRADALNRWMKFTRPPR